METHRYVRKRLVGNNGVDRYDLDNQRSTSSSSLQNQTEYWTNGRVTLLNVPGKTPTATITTTAATATKYFSPADSGIARKTQYHTTSTRRMASAATSASDKFVHLPGRSSIMSSSESSLLTPPPPPSSSQSRPRATKNTNNNTTAAAAAAALIPNASSLQDDGTEMSTTTTASASSTNQSKVVRNSLIAGSFAGMASVTACHPFDVLRIKMQSAALAPAASTTTTTSTGAATTNANLGVIATFRNTLQYGGIRALYTGLALPLGAQAVYKSTVFTVNNVTQTAIINWKTQENRKLGIFQTHELTTFDRFLCGFMGGAVNGSLFVTPVEYVRNQLITQHGADGAKKQTATTTGSSSSTSFKGPFDVIRRTIKSDGVVGLWRGMASTVLRDSVGCGCFFVTMAYTQKVLSPMYNNDGDDSRPPTSAVLVTSGALAGLSFWLWALPLDTMKTWIQSGKARDMRHAWELSQRNGFIRSIPSLFRGWEVAYGRGIPSAAITVTTYSFIYRCLGQQQQT